MKKRGGFAPNPEVGRLYTEELLTVQQVADRLGMSAYTARRHLDALEIEVQRGGRRIPHLPMDQICEEYEGGASTVTLAEKYGVDQGTIFKRLQRLGMTRTVAEATELHLSRPMLAPGSVENLAGDLGVDPDRLRDLLVRHGFLRPSAGR
jgi:AraC-like DNA-binding protein